MAKEEVQLVMSDYQILLERLEFLTTKLKKLQLEQQQEQSRLNYQSHLEFPETRRNTGSIGTNNSKSSLCGAEENKYNEQLKVTITNINSLVDSMKYHISSLNESQLNKFEIIKKLQINNYKDLFDNSLKSDQIFKQIFGDLHSLPKQQTALNNESNQDSLNVDDQTHNDARISNCCVIV